MLTAIIHRNQRIIHPEDSDSLHKPADQHRPYHAVSDKEPSHKSTLTSLQMDAIGQFWEGLRLTHGIYSVIYAGVAWVRGESGMESSQLTPPEEDATFIEMVVLVFVLAGIALFCSFATQAAHGAYKRFTGKEELARLTAALEKSSADFRALEEEFEEYRREAEEIREERYETQGNEFKKSHEQTQDLMRRVVDKLLTNLEALQGHAGLIDRMTALVEAATPPTTRPSKKDTQG